MTRSRRRGCASAGRMPERSTTSAGGSPPLPPASASIGSGPVVARPGGPGRRAASGTHGRSRRAERSRGRSCDRGIRRFRARCRTGPSRARRAGRVRAPRCVRGLLRRDRRHRAPHTGRGPSAREPGPPPRSRGDGRSGGADLVRRREVVDAFLAAARGGDFDALLAVLDPDVVLRPDATAARMGNVSRGARRGTGRDIHAAVARTHCGSHSSTVSPVSHGCPVGALSAPSSSPLPAIASCRWI